MHEDITTGELEALTIQNYLQVALLSVLVFDHLLCLSDEITYIWLARPNLTTFLYIVTRYCPVAKIIFVVVAFSKTFSHCTALYRVVGILNVFTRAGILTVVFLRTYAMCYSRMCPPVVILALLSLTVIIMGFYEVSKTLCPESSYFGVVIASPKWMTVVSVLGLAAEAFAIVIILYQSRQFRKFSFPSGSILRFLVEKSLICFFAAFILELSAILLNLPVIKPELRGFLNSVPIPVPAILACRFLLDLRSLSRLPASGNYSFDTVSFISVMPPFDTAFDVDGKVLESSRISWSSI